MELQYYHSKAVVVTALAFPQADVNNFILGSEDGSVYTGDYQSNQSLFLIRVLFGFIYSFKTLLVAVCQS